MTKQTKSLGGLADIQASPPPETTEERIDRLERRLTQAEVLLNDVMQQLDKPYRDQHVNGKPHRSEKPQQANPVKPQQANPAKPQQAKPQQTKPKRVNPPPLPPATEAQTQAHAEAAITFLSQDPEKLWHGAKLRTAVKDHCATSNQKAILAMKLLRRTGYLVIVKDVEVCGETLDGAYKFIPDPQTPEADPKPTPPTPHTPASQALSQEKTQADNIAIIALLSQEPDKIWGCENLRSAIQELCSLSNKQVASAIKRFRKTGHLSLQKDVEVDGSILKGAFQFVQNPEPTAEQIAIQEKEAALLLEQQAESARKTADACDKLLSVLASSDRITPEALIEMGIGEKQQRRVRKSDAYKESGASYKRLPDETHEYSLEITD